MPLFFRQLLVSLACVLACALAAAKPVTPDRIPDRQEALPKPLEGVGIDEHLDTELPLDLEFTDERGERVRLRDYFDGRVPVILTLNYSDCPMLCSLELNGLVTSMKEIDWSLGKEYRVVTVSIDPKETPDKARLTKQRYLTQYGRPGSEHGWSFLVGSEQNIHTLADAVGFRYRYIPEKKEYYHAAALALATPDGRIGRYLYGIEFHPRTLRLGLTESGEGKIGSAMDQLILFCSMYDSREGSYALVASRVMTIGALVTLVLLAGLLGLLWSAELRKKRRAQNATT